MGTTESTGEDPVETVASRSVYETIAALRLATRLSALSGTVPVPGVLSKGTQMMKERIRMLTR